MQQLIQTNEIVKWIFISIICETISAIIDVFLFTNLFKIKTTRETKIKVILTDGFLRTIFLIFIPIPFNRMANLVITVVLFKVFFKANIEKCVFGEVINSMTFLVTETLLAKLFCVLMPCVDTYVSALYNCTYVGILKMSVSICRFVICYIIKKKRIYVNIIDNLSKKNRNNIIIVSILEYIIIFFNEAEMTMYISDFPYTIFLLDITSIIICFYISMKAILRISILEEQDMKINELTSYNKTLSIMYDSIRGF